MRRTGASAGVRNANRVSNLGFAVVLTFPLCLIGVVSQWAFPSSAPSAGAAGGEDMGRVHGVLEPPVNPWLRDDIVHAGRRKGHARPALADRISMRAAAMMGAAPRRREGDAGAPRES